MKILFIHKQILFPRDTGGKIRVLNLLKHLGKRHDITYVSNLRPGERKYLPQMEALGLRIEIVNGETSKRGGARFYGEAIGNLLSPYPFTVSRNFDPKLRAKVEELISTEPFDLLICDTIAMARHTIGLQTPPSVLFQHNVEAQILRHHAAVAPRGPKQLYMRDQWRKMLRFEKNCGKHFDVIIAVSKEDRNIFENNYEWKNVHAIDTAVDEEFFIPDLKAEVPNRIVFLGSMDWMPNQDGVAWFIREVWPKVRSTHPNAMFHVVGRNPPAKIQSLAKIPGVSIIGGVPDVRPHLAEASVVVVPLLVGGGTRLKIYEAMAMSKPVVSTTIGAEGLPIEPGNHYLRSDLPTDFAADVVKLLDSAAMRDHIGRTANQFVRQNYGSEPIARQFEAICEEAATNCHSRISESS